MRPRRLGLFVVIGLLASIAAGPATTPARSPSTEAQARSSKLKPPVNPEARKEIAAGRELEESDFAEARVWFERAAKRAKATGDVGALAMAHDGFGTLAFGRGDLQTALIEFRKSLEIWPAAGEPAEQALTMCDLAQLHLALGLNQEALGIYTQALRLIRGQKRTDVLVMVYDGLGLAYHGLGNLNHAQGAYERVLSIAENPEDLARTHSRLGTLYRDRGDLNRATRELWVAISLAKKAGKPRWHAFSLADLAHLEDLRGRDAEGLRLFDEAFALLESAPEPLVQASMLFGRAEVLRDLKRLDEALASLERSIDLAEKTRTSLDDPGARVSFFSHRQRYYDLYVTLLMDRYRRDRSAAHSVEAFEMSDLSHSRSLLDDLTGKPEPKGHRLEEIQRELLDSETTLLAYSIGDRGSYLWVVNQDHIEVLDLGDPKRIQTLAFEARAQFAKDGRKPDVEALARIVLPPRVEPLLRDRLLIRPDGALHGIPFNAFPMRDGKFLIEEHIVSSIPSASFMVEMRKSLAARRLAPKQLAVLGDAVFELRDQRLSGIKSDGSAQSRGLGRELDPGDLPRLDFSDDEAEAILKLVPPADRFAALGFEANRDVALNRSLANYQIIHITTHHIVADHPDFSGLMLSRYTRQGGSREGLLRASEIYGLSLPAELVVLSACGSGLGVEVRGEGPMSMTRAFLHAGAKRVVVSLWDVQDRPTSELMTRFYRQMLVEKLPAAEALRAAQLSMINSPQWKDPSLWAAFVLQGEPL